MGLIELNFPNFTGYTRIDPRLVQEGDDLFIHDTFNNSWTVITAERVAKSAFGNGVKISNERVGFNIVLGEDSPLAVFRRPKPLPEGIGAVIEFVGGSRHWRLVRTDVNLWALLRKHRVGYTFDEWVTNEGAAERVGEAADVRIVTEGVIL